MMRQPALGALISYAREDERFASWLERTLERYARPRPFSRDRQGAFRLFVYFLSVRLLSWLIRLDDA